MGKLQPVTPVFAQTYPNVQTFTFEKVTSEAVLEQEWEPLLVEIFPDEGDREDIALLKERLANGENFFIMRDQDGKAMGIELSQVLNPDDKNTNGRAMYIPWTGVVEKYRNNGIGSSLNRAIGEYMKETYGVTHTIIDIEDPDRLDDAGYEDVETAKGFAERRINFWRRERFIVVDDESKPAGEKLEYVRPASDDDQQIQAYDHLTIRFENDALKQRVFNEQTGEIDKDFVRQCYLEMNQIQYGNYPEAELCQMYPAIKQYLHDIDAHPGQTLKIRTSGITPKRTPDVDIQTRMVDSKKSVSGSHLIQENNL